MKLTDELYGGARLSYIFRSVFSENLARIGALDGLSDERIRIAMQNAFGLRPCLFVPEMAFEILVKHQVCRGSRARITEAK